MTFKYLLWTISFAIFLLLNACSNDDKEASTLEAYIAQHPDKLLLDDLVACAAGGQDSFLIDEVLPVNLFFYPEIGASEFNYYETSGIDVDTSNLSNFDLITKEDVPVFNGFLRRFKLPEKNQAYWTRVSFIDNDTLWYSKPIRMDKQNKPTQFAPNLCEVDLSNKQEPLFTWEDGQYSDNIIYFQVISDRDQNALSGTYTEELNFQYYNLENVVFNVTHPNQNVALEIGENYFFTMMGVDVDNWVNLIIQKEFSVE